METVVAVLVSVALFVLLGYIVFKLFFTPPETERIEEDLEEETYSPEPIPTSASSVPYIAPTHYEPSTVRPPTKRSPDRHGRDQGNDGISTPLVMGATTGALYATPQPGNDYLVEPAPYPIEQTSLPVANDGFGGNSSFRPASTDDSFKASPESGFSSSPSSHTSTSETSSDSGSSYSSSAD